MEIVEEMFLHLLGIYFVGKKFGNHVRMEVGGQAGNEL
jgi:hypothetical protein